MRRRRANKKKAHVRGGKRLKTSTLGGGTWGGMRDGIFEGVLDTEKQGTAVHVHIREESGKREKKP